MILCTIIASNGRVVVQFIYHKTYISINLFGIHCIKNTAVLKVETDIITSMTVSMIGRAMILMIVYVETSKTHIIVFICNIIMCLTSHWLIVFSIRVSLLILTISLSEIKGNVSKHLVRSKEMCPNTWWDQRKCVQTLGEIKGNVSKHSVRSKEMCPNTRWDQKKCVQALVRSKEMCPNTRWDQRKCVQITDKYHFLVWLSQATS